MNASDILNRLTTHKLSQEAAVKFYIHQDSKTGEKVNWCGSWLHLREWTNSEESRLINANFCKRTLLCRACAARRAGKLTEAYLPKVEQVLKGDETLIPAMMTLTVKNGPDLEERVEHLRDSWTRMITARRLHSCKPDRNPAVEFCKAEGWVKSLEITKGKDGWHPHLHVFCLLRNYVSHPELSSEWERFTGDSKIVGITKCKGGILPGLIEVLKYSTKFAELEPADSWEIHSKLFGSRFTDNGGCLRGIKSGPLEEDDISQMEGPYRDFIASWVSSKSQAGYVLREAETVLEAVPDGFVSVLRTKGTDGVRPEVFTVART